MPKYRRIPGEPIEAIQWHPGVEHPGVYRRHEGYFVITIHDQRTWLADGDWILSEPDGIHYYPCKPDVFAKTYEPVGTPEAITRQMTDAILHGQGMTTAHIPIVDMIDATAAVDTTDITEGALAPGVISNREPASSSGLPDDWFEEHDGQRLVLIPEKVRQHIAELEAQLQAEGEHTAAANANIDRLNTEIERITRRQQGDLMGKE